MNKLISIVLPTYNRIDYLKITLKHFRPQVLRNSQKVELIICNNASTDGTDFFFERHDNNSFFKYINYKDHIDVGLSIKRSISNATGRYVLLWGDDDLPFPFLLDILLQAIVEFPNAGIIHFNRLIGYDDNITRMSNLSIQKKNFFETIIEYKELSEFIEKYYLDTSFLSSLIFLKSNWDKCLNIDTSKHYGYEFLAPIYKGCKNMTALYINYPLCIQRKPEERIWLNKHPLYRFIGIPNLLNDFEKWGLIRDAKKLWMNEANSNEAFFKVIMQTSIDKNFYKPLVNQINQYQDKMWRKVLTYFFVYFFPSLCYKYLRKFNIKKNNS